MENVSPANNSQRAVNTGRMGALGMWVPAGFILRTLKVIEELDVSLDAPLEELAIFFVPIFM